VSGERTVQAKPSLEPKIVSVASASLWFGVEAQQDLAKSAPFRNLAVVEFIKIMGVRNG
jgi:hypothetical protein